MDHRTAARSGNLLYPFPSVFSQCSECGGGARRAVAVAVFIAYCSLTVADVTTWSSLGAVETGRLLPCVTTCFSE